METWFIIIVSLCVAALIRSLLLRRSDGKKLPPGPSLLASNFILLTNSLSGLEPILRNIKSKYGPIITLSIGSRPSIFVGNHSLAHQLLIQKGAVFSDRPRTFAVRNISSAAYGPTWRVLRRNLTSEVLHHSRVKSYSWARKWVLQILIGRLQGQKEVTGIKTGEDTVHKQMERTLTNTERSRTSVDDLMPHIKSRIEAAKSAPQSERIVAYVDTLVNLQLPEEETNNGNGGKLTHKEMVSMCGEFLNAGTDTTATALQWIMANLVKHPDIQSKLYEEIVSIVGPPPPPPPPGVEPESAINDEDLKKMPYLKAVILEALRRHPPGHFVLPHRVTKEMEVQGFTIPQGATINFMVAEMGLDPTVWDDPMEFKPERFLVNENNNGVFDITGSKGIKMMPFGAGRRICPGSDLALLHLEYFVANLILYFNWSPPDGYHVDLTEKIEFTIVMKYPLQAKISPRTEKITS